MSDTIVREWEFFLYSIATGTCFGFIYDSIRFFRHICHHCKWVMHFEDIIYWIICFFISFYLLYYGNNCVLRFAAVLGASIGLGVYCATFGRFMVILLCRGFKAIMLPIKGVKKLLTEMALAFKMKLK